MVMGRAAKNPGVGLRVRCHRREKPNASLGSWIAQGVGYVRSLPPK